MCDSRAFFKRTDGEELLLEEVASIKPTENGYKLVSLFGEEVEVIGTLEEINLLKNRIVFVD